MRVLNQCAALPYVACGEGMLVLLITTRGRGRWTIPKGWPKAGTPKATMAAREAFEEAGVKGELSDTPIGSYDYTKRLHLFAWIRCRVEVYALRVDRQYLVWPEQESRKLVWVGLDKAASLVREPQLKALLRSLGTSGPLSGRPPRSLEPAGSGSPE